MSLLSQTRTSGTCAQGAQKMTGAQKVLSLKTMAAALTLPSLREVKMILSSTLLQRIGPIGARTKFQPLQQSWTHPLRCFTLERPRQKEDAGTQRQVSNSQSQEKTRSSGLDGSHRDAASHHSKRQKISKNVGNKRRKCGVTSPTRMCLENRL